MAIRVLSLLFFTISNIVFAQQAQQQCDDKFLLQLSQRTRCYYDTSTDSCKDAVIAGVAGSVGAAASGKWLAEKWKEAAALQAEEKSIKGRLIYAEQRLESLKRETNTNEAILKKIAAQEEYTKYLEGYHKFFKDVQAGRVHLTVYEPVPNSFHSLVSMEKTYLERLPVAERDRIMALEKEFGRDALMDKLGGPNERYASIREKRQKEVKKDAQQNLSRATSEVDNLNKSLIEESKKLSSVQSNLKTAVRQKFAAGAGLAVSMGLMVLAREDVQDWLKNDTDTCINEIPQISQRVILGQYASFKKVDGKCQMVIPHFKFAELMRSPSDWREGFLRVHPEYCAKLQEAYNKMKFPDLAVQKSEQLTCDGKGNVSAVKFDDGDVITMKRVEGNSNCVRFEGAFPSNGMMTNRPERYYNFPMCTFQQAEHSAFGEMENPIVAKSMNDRIPIGQLAPYYKEPKCQVASINDTEGARNCAAFNYLRIKQFVNTPMMDFCRWRRTGNYDPATKAQK